MAKRAEGWKVCEDEFCQARLIFGGDPQFGANQKDSTMWENIHGYYDSHRPDGANYRDQKSCNIRWKKISKECMIYSASLNIAEAARSSGENYTDMVLLAESNYFKVANKPFKLQHCWKLLKDEPKFQNPPALGTPINLGDGGTPGSEEGTPSSARPIGQKATKAARRKKNQPTESSKYMEELLAWTKAQDVETAASRAKEIALAEAAFQQTRDDITMQVDPNAFTPNKKMYWERRQKVIMDREMADESTPMSGPSSSAARNLFPSLQDTQWDLGNHD